MESGLGKGSAFGTADCAVREVVRTRQSVRAKAGNMSRSLSSQITKKQKENPKQ
jgi:hypothetical protein